MQLKVELWVEHLGDDYEEEFSKEELEDEDKLKEGIRDIVEGCGDFCVTYILTDPDTGKEVKRGRFDL